MFLRSTTLVMSVNAAEANALSCGFAGDSKLVVCKNAIIAVVVLDFHVEAMRVPFKRKLRFNYGVAIVVFV